MLFSKVTNSMMKNETIEIVFVAGDDYLWKIECLSEVIDMKLATKNDWLS